MLLEPIDNAGLTCPLGGVGLARIGKASKAMFPILCSIPSPHFRGDRVGAVFAPIVTLLEKLLTGIPMGSPQLLVMNGLVFL